MIYPNCEMLLILTFQGLEKLNDDLRFSLWILIVVMVDIIFNWLITNNGKIQGNCIYDILE